MWDACRTCILDKSLGHIPENTPQDKIDRYKDAVYAFVREHADQITPPELAYHIKHIREELFALTPADFSAVKSHYNRLLLSFEEKLAGRIRQAEDPLLCAMQYAMTGNYIDFSALATVEEATLLALLEQSATIALDEEVYGHLKDSVRTAGKMVYLTDNCGEIVLDKLLIREFMNLNPELSVTVLVRGSSEGNDATMEDADEVGLPAICHVMGNGAPYDATVLPRMSEEARDLMYGADLIISKGQANYESMYGCGLHVFYLFMCKCDYFTKRFQVPRYTGILTEE